MQVFVLVVPLIHSHPSNLMLTTTGMQTWAPLLIWCPIATGCEIIPEIHPYQACWQYHCLLGWGWVCCVWTSHRWKSSWVVEFSNILHVLELQNNLLSILYLTCHLGFVVYINATHMLFSHSSGPPLFVITINNHNVTFLDGMIQCVTQYA